MSFAPDFGTTPFSLSAFTSLTCKEIMGRRELPPRGSPLARCLEDGRSVEFSSGVEFDAAANAELSDIANILLNLQARARDYVVLPAIFVEGHFSADESAELGFRRAAHVVDALRNLNVDTRFIASETAANNSLRRCAVVRVMV